ncbi:hypothetical protein H5407_08075 [Mitsuaria sp. WAJ17]|uniref:CTP synthase C-terminal region-related (seleno)protein n=1 Tax=Mitsuaria sp. WAJ17 TaxID=2761452 RepID=UPI0016045B2D|nr:hypothetical protein [Mitsuaria sp. WAJ17]MBB2485188.1 hypothetical protein [Mitsuaria sp. WAJ17]
MRPAHAIELVLVGDRDEAITAHRAIPLALDLASQALHLPLQARWVATDEVGDGRALQAAHGVWCVPGSPYRSMDGALRAIRQARETGQPFLGTCGGFQHAAIEYARHVLGWVDAEHEETAGPGERRVIHQLACELVEQNERLAPLPGTRLHAAYEGQPFSEGYRCRFGLNPDFVAALTAGPLKAAALGPDEQVRAVELKDHPFFVAALFQLERQALQGKLPTLVKAWVEAAAVRAAGQEARSCC